MVIKGASRRSVEFWTRHLANDKKNDRAELKEIRGLGAENLKDALLEMQEDARFTRCKNFFYQANFNPCPHERLTEEQWQRAFEIFENHRGIPAGQARIVYEHEKEGRIHRHVIWSRIDLETMRAWPDNLDAKICHAASREISEELGLQRSRSPFDKDREGPRPARAPESWEMFRGLRSGLDPRDIKAEVTGIFRESANGAEFVAGLREHGYEVVRGDKRDFCILDNAGDVHSLARCIEGVRTKELRSFMQGIDRRSLPTVEQAKTQFRERMMAEHQADLASVQREIAWEEALAKAAIEKEKAERRFVEPTPEEIRKQGGREKVWPMKPPESERTQTSPRYHFEDAARETTRPEPQPVMPENLKGTAAHIWTAYNARMWEQKQQQPDGSIQIREIALKGERDPYQFAATLEAKGMTLARVTKDEAERSQKEAAHWKKHGEWQPSYREGEFLVITQGGNVYSLNKRTTGHDPKQVQSFLEKADWKGLSGIDGTKQIMQARAELRFSERQAIHDKINAARMERATTVNDRAPKGGEKGKLKQIKIASSAGIAAANAAFKGAEKIADGLLGMFDPVLTPAQKAEGEIASREREADARQTIDFAKYTSENTQRSQEEQERQRAHEKERGEQGRER